MEISKLETKGDLENIFREYNEIVYRSILFKVYMRKELAEDLVSETFIRAWKYRKSFNPKKANMKTWLLKIGFNLCIDNFKKNSQVHIDLDLIADQISSFENFEEELEKDLLRKHIYQSFHLLSEKDRELLSLRYIEELELKEIAEVIGEPYVITKVAINRAFKKLKNHIKNE